jgi:hypothetical protein
VVVDGLGEGYWPGPGNWVGYKDAGWALMATSEQKEAYNSFWKKEITTEDPDFIRFKYPRWENYKDEAIQFKKDYGASTWHLDQRPSVVKHFKGFFDVAGGPRMWDEDGWPKAFPYNPVERAFRTVTFVREGSPYLLVTDDIQKDDKERLYEWQAMMGTNTDMVSIKGNDILLSDATEPRDPVSGEVKPKKGDRVLLVRILKMNTSATPLGRLSEPNIALQAIDKVDAKPNERDFGNDKRLVIGTRAVAPDFEVMLFPLHFGEALPKTEWSADGSTLTVVAGGKTDVFTFSKSAEGRTLITAKRGESVLSLQ